MGSRRRTRFGIALPSCDLRGRTTMGVRLGTENTKCGERAHVFGQVGVSMEGEARVEERTALRTSRETTERKKKKGSGENERGRRSRRRRRARSKHLLTPRPKRPTGVDIGHRSALSAQLTPNLSALPLPMPNPARFEFSLRLHSATCLAACLRRLPHPRSTKRQ